MKGIQEIIDGMTLREKVAFCTGASFWETKDIPAGDVPRMIMTDGPHGLRYQKVGDMSDMLGLYNSVPATCFPAESLTAASFDEALLEDIGGAIGREAAAQRIGVVLGPGLNMKRNPLGGRNFEYFSEDPYLAGKMGAGYVRGMEAQGVGATIKHFACNSQEDDRMRSDSVVDERTLREIYLRAFEIAVKEGHPSCVMSSYNKINGVYSSDNKWLLTDTLRNDWGFDGMVVTDWGGMSDRIKAFRAGNDLAMPGGNSYMEEEVLAAVERGELSVEDIDRSVRRILQLVRRSLALEKTPAEFDAKAHHEIACRAAAESMVLLKNSGALPLAKDAKACLIGAMAKNMRFQGGGSSHINPTFLTHPVDAMPSLPFVQGCLDDGTTTDELIAEAVKAAQAADIPVVFAGLPEKYESEGFDRFDMRMPEGHLRLIRAVAAANPNTVVVLMCGSVVECDWVDQVNALLYAGLPGQAGGEAIRRVLYGEVVPSGRLAETWPFRYADCATADTFSQTLDAIYSEGLYIGYRYYDKANVPVRWRFGYGLSYTTFRVSDLVLEGRRATVTVENTGDRAGKDAILFYLSGPQGGLHRAVKELRGIRKVFLEPGEKKTVSVEFTDRDLAVWQDGWHVEKGAYTVEVEGLQGTFFSDGEVVPVPAWQCGSWYETCCGAPRQADLEKVLGRGIRPIEPVPGNFTLSSSLLEMKDYSEGVMQMYRGVEQHVRQMFGGNPDPDDPNFVMMMNASAGGPIRTMALFSGMDLRMLQALVDSANAAK